MCEAEKNKCDLCDAPATLKCGACQRVWYCSRDHQKKKWKEHKIICIAFKIEDTQSILGRQLISARDVKQGDLIVSSPPCIIGPRLDCPKPTCIRCHLVLEEDPVLCEGSCGYHLCKSDCEGNLHSKEECSLLNAMEIPPKKKLEIISILRFALLKTSNPMLYEKLKLLEDHVEELKKAGGERWKGFENNILGPLRAIKDELEIQEEAELEKLLGIWITNSFELDRRGMLVSGEKCPGESIQGIYDVPSLMNHDCIGNTRLVINNGFHIDIYASVPIKRSSRITFNYCSPLDDFSQRQRSLRENKFFVCKCERCEDSSELGTFSSSLLCQACKEAPALRVRENKTYECRDCSAVMPKKDLVRIMNTLNQGKQRLHRIGKAWTSCIRFLNEYEQILWKSHVFILEIKMALIHIIRGNPSASNMNESAHEFQSKRRSFCQDLLEVQNVVEPGNSLGRGLILHELHSAQVYLGNYDFERAAEEGDEPSQEDRMRLLITLYDALENLMQAWKCLFVEPKKSVLGQRALVMHTEMEELENYISMVKTI
eukprot:TRINITY_DN5148_c0_g1_i1.p1 TRINITY_DN5148_c0_g1~~TRINITY_DN5148_c0_g1_i1.p1  ORF type:complete len:543 (-),score=128.12 TRINITY_DN5148_c0_g1_i1:82-1710(-)